MRGAAAEGPRGPRSGEAGPGRLRGAPRGRRLARPHLSATRLHVAPAPRDTGARRQRARPAADRQCPRAALRPDPPRVTGATYLAAGRPQGTPPLPGPAANCPRACALQASGPDPGPEKKTKSPAAPGGRPGKCEWRALAKALLTRLSPPWQGYSGCVF